LTIYPTEFLAQGPLETHGFGFQAEALLKAVASGYSFVEIALPVDAKNLPMSRSITPGNIVDATLTILRLVWEFYIVGRSDPRRLRSAPGRPQVKAPTKSASARPYGLRSSDAATRPRAGRCAS